jgi:hypothetical protein
VFPPPRLYVRTSAEERYTYLNSALSQVKRMSIPRTLLLLGLLVQSAAACKRTPEAPPPPPAVEEPAPPAVQALADGAPCLEATECTSGVCEGHGCDEASPGRCAPAWSVRSCTFDLRQYCGCNGVTFSASGSCPGHRYAHDGECATALPPE